MKYSEKLPSARCLPESPHSRPARGQVRLVYAEMTEYSWQVPGVCLSHHTLDQLVVRSGWCMQRWQSRAGNYQVSAWVTTLPTSSWSGQAGVCKDDRVELASTRCLPWVTTLQSSCESGWCMQRWQSKADKCCGTVQCCEVTTLWSSWPGSFDEMYSNVLSLLLNFRLQLDPGVKTLA